MSVRGLRLFFDTVRHLRPGQIWGRLWFRVYRPRRFSGATPRLRSASSEWRLCARPARMLPCNTFVFQGVQRRIAGANDWNNPGWPKLWLYNLHYFDDLVAVGAASRKDQHRSFLLRWVAENPVNRGNGWEPYPTSLRIVNWIKWTFAGNSLDQALMDSLAAQCHCLRHRLEYHLLGNHLWANAKALVFAGCFFEGRQADQWRDKGLQVLRRELREQVLADGGHFERSPMYHALVLEDLLDLAQLASRYPDLFDDTQTQEWHSTLVRMSRWLAVMTHPDGEMAFFNDAAIGVAPNLRELKDYARALGWSLPEVEFVAIEALPDSGYVRLQWGAAVVIADVGEIGPSYLPGHAHADTLSFEWSLRGQRVLVNGGTSTYEAGAERVRQRGTAAHNAVVVDGEDSSEIWSSFRVARRASPVDVRWGENEQGVWLEAGHDGYRRLAKVGNVRRTWRLGSHQIMVEDQVEGKPHSALAFFHAHPSWRPTQRQPGNGELCSSTDRIVWEVSADSSVQVQGGTWHPRFGESHDNQTLLVGLCAGRAVTEFRWE